jgi:hypothetical protein
MEKWKEWAAFYSDVISDYDRANGLALGVSELIGKAQCLQCAGAFLERCNVIKHFGFKHPATSPITFMVCTVLRMLQPFYHPNISPAGRTAIVRTVFREWWDSPRIQLSSVFRSHSDLLVKAIEASRPMLPLDDEERDEEVLCVLRTLSEENIQWWSGGIFVDRDAGFHTKAFKLMIEDMNRTLAPLSGSDAEHMRSSYIKEISSILTPWLVDGDHLELQVFIESEGIKLGGKSALGDVADEINLPLLIHDICAGKTNIDAKEAIALNSNIKWFASLYHHTRGTARLKWTRSCWKTQTAICRCRMHASDELILDAMELLMMHFRPFSVNPYVFGSAVHKVVTMKSDGLGDDRFGNKLILLFLNHAEERLWCTWPSTQNEVKEYFGDNISHVFVELFSDQTTPHKEFFSLMSHVFVNACLAGRDDGDSEWGNASVGPDWGLNDMYRMLRLRPSDFAPEVREHENFWLKDDTSEADKKTALHLAQSSIDKYKEKISDGVYKEIMDGLMAEWRG